MATATGLALLERHRLAQGQIAAATAADVVRLWPVLASKGALESNTPRWLQALLLILGTRRAQSAALAVQYLTAYRVAELGPAGAAGGFIPTAAGTLDQAATTTSLMVLGPTAYRGAVAKQLGIPTYDLTPAMLRDNPLGQGIQAKLAANTARASMRHVGNGGRQTVDDALTNDKAVVGYYRQTTSSPCWFCAMLASRGPVYEQDSFSDSDPRFEGPGNQKVHDGCGCRLLPLYSTSNPELVAHVRKYEDLWKQTGNALDFRRAYEGRAA